jgi:polyhydroxyalkanoate synthesis regulator phasin
VRKKLVIATAAGALTLTGLAVAVPALADTGTTGTSASSVVDRIRDALSGLVDDGSITPEQADEVATTLGEAGPGGRGGHHGGPLDLAAAATALDMSEDELRTALAADGATPASVAEDRGVAVDDLVAALTDAAETRLAEAVEQGRLTQGEADERLADLAERIAERVDDEFGSGGRGGRHIGRPGD